MKSKIKLELVTLKAQSDVVKDIIINHHSYVPTHKSVGRRIDWLIYHEEYLNGLLMMRPVGMIGVGSSVYPPPKDILKYINCSKSEYKEIFNTMANNWRFCMSENIKNAGTQILKQLRNLAPIEWKKKYDNDLKYLFTFVGGGNNGAVYRADNWNLIGETAGLPKHKSSSMKWNSKEELKTLFVKPTGEDKKLIFGKKI